MVAISRGPDLSCRLPLGDSGSTRIVSWQTCRAGIVREPDELRVAQQFIAGSGASTFVQVGQVFRPVLHSNSLLGIRWVSVQGRRVRETED